MKNPNSISNSTSHSPLIRGVWGVSFILLVILLLPIGIQAQMQGFFPILDTTTVFNRSLPKYQVVFDQTGSKFYELNAATLSTKKLSNCSKTLIGGSGSVPSWDTTGVFTFVKSPYTRVGIGTSSPSYPLQVNGIINFDSTGLYMNSVPFIHIKKNFSGGDPNMFIGRYAGNTSASLVGRGNLGIGTSSLRALTGGLVNLGIGYNTLRGVTTASGNVAIGGNAMSVTPFTGAYNTIVGQSSGDAMSSSGGNNTWFGYNNDGGGSNNILLGTGNSTANKINTILVGNNITATTDYQIIFGDALTTRQALIQSFSVGIGAVSPLHKFVVVGMRSTNPTLSPISAQIPVFNFVNGDATYGNKHRVTVANATDSFSFSRLDQAYSGKATYRITGANDTILQIDTNNITRTLRFTKTIRATAKVDTFDWSKGDEQQITLTNGAHTFIFQNPPVGAVTAMLTIWIKQPAAGAGTVTFPAAVVWSGGNAPVLTTTVNNTDIITLKYNGRILKYAGNFSPNYSGF